MVWAACNSGAAKRRALQGDSSDDDDDDNDAGQAMKHPSGLYSYEARAAKRTAEQKPPAAKVGICASQC